MIGKLLYKTAEHKHFFFLLILCCGLAKGVVDAQSAQSQPVSAQSGQMQSKDEGAAELAKAMASLKSGKDFGGYYAEVILEARAVEAIPDLEKQFTMTSEPIEKAKIAQVLLFLGDKKSPYWDYLSQLLTDVVESNAPDPALYDEQGKQIPGLSKKFLSWAQSRGESPKKAGEDAVYIWPAIVMLAGGSEDARAIPLLRRAFSSPNPLIQNASALGLAEMNDVSSVPLLIARCKEVPPNVASLIAGSLVYFEDPEAQKTVDTYVPKEMARALRERKAAGKSALHGR